MSWINETWDQKSWSDKECGVIESYETVIKARVKQEWDTLWKPDDGEGRGRKEMSWQRMSLSAKRQCYFVTLFYFIVCVMLSEKLPEKYLIVLIKIVRVPNRILIRGQALQKSNDWSFTACYNQLPLLSYGIAQVIPKSEKYAGILSEYWVLDRASKRKKGKTYKRERRKLYDPSL